MSYELYPWAWKQKLRAPEKIVLLYLVDSAREHNAKSGFICWPSLLKISDKTGLSKSSIVRCLVQLEDRELIQRFRSKGGNTRSSKYKINRSADAISNDTQLSQRDTANCTRETQLNNQLSQSDTATVSERHTNSVTVTHEPVRTNKEPIIASRRFSTKDESLAKQMFSDLQKINPGHKKPNLENWADVIRLMRERDKKSIEEISSLWDWVRGDDFWAPNVLCPSKLREKWDQLSIKIKSAKKPNEHSVQTCTEAY